MEDVIKDMAGKECAIFETVLRELIGKTMILYQEDGDMVVLFSCVAKKTFRRTKYYGKCIRYDENGKFIEYTGKIGSTYVDELELKYFGDQT